MKCCGNCKWWEPDGETNEAGHEWGICYWTTEHKIPEWMENQGDDYQLSTAMILCRCHEPKEADDDR